MDVLGKQEFGRRHRRGASSVTRWIKLGLPVQPDGKIPVAAGDAWVNTQLDHSQDRRADSPPPLPLESAIGSGSQELRHGAESFAEARRQRAWHDAREAELRLAERERQLYSKAGVEAFAADLKQHINAILPAAVIDAAERGRGCITGPDAHRVGEQLARAALTRLADAIERSVQEIATDG